MSSWPAKVTYRDLAYEANETAAAAATETHKQEKDQNKTNIRHTMYFSALYLEVQLQQIVLKLL